jgi:carbamoyl-phosphate synthase large subunit
MNILFTCSGRRHYLLDYFKKILGANGLVVAVDSQSTAPSFGAADFSFKVPSIYHSDYIIRLKNIIEMYQIEAVIPLNDLELPILSRHKQELELLNTKVIVSNSDFINICSDKWETFNYLKELNISTPNSYLNISDTLKAISKGEIRFPVIVKPRWGSGSFGIEEVDNEIELQLAFELLKIRLKKSFLKNMNLNNVNEAIIIQEKLIGEEYGMDILNDFDGNFIECFTRQKLAMRSGETDKAKTVIGENYSRIGKKIAEASKHMGIMDIDFFICDDEIIVLELNPRFGGGYPFTHEAGGNIAAMYVEWLEGIKDVSHHNQFMQGIQFSKYDKMFKIINQRDKKNELITY